MKLVWFLIFSTVVFAEDISYEEDSYYPCIYESGMRCQCIPALKLIDCSGLGLTEPPIPENLLREFVTFSLKDNDIQSQIPGEAELLAAFPDLKVVDLRGNPDLNCRLINRLRYKKLRIISRCSLANVLIEMPPGTTTTTAKPPATCDIWCKIRVGITNAALQVYSETQSLVNTIKKRLGS